MSIIILVISFILNLASKIVTPIGLIAFFFMIAEGEFEILYPMGILGVIGIVYGIIAFRYDIPPQECFGLVLQMKYSLFLLWQ